MANNDQPNPASDLTPDEENVAEAVIEEAYIEEVDIVETRLPEASDSSFEPPSNPVPTPSQLPEDVFRNFKEEKEGHFEALDGTTVVWRADKKHWWQRSHHSSPPYQENTEAETTEAAPETVEAAPETVEAAPVPDNSAQVLPAQHIESPEESSSEATSVIEESSTLPVEAYPDAPNDQIEGPSEVVEYQGEVEVSGHQGEIEVGEKKKSFWSKLFKGKEPSATPPQAPATEEPLEASTAADWADSQPPADNEASQAAEAVVTTAVVVDGGVEGEMSKADQRRRQKRLKKEAAERRKEAKKQARQERFGELRKRLKRDPMSDRRNKRIGADAERKSLLASEGPDFVADSADETSPEAIAALTEGIVDANAPTDGQVATEALISDDERDQSRQERKRAVVITPKDELEELEESGSGSRFFTKLLRQYGDMIGVDIGARHIRVAHVKDGQLLLLASRQLPLGLFEDSLLVEPELFSREIAILWKEAAIPSKRINFSVLNRQVAMRLLELQAEEREDLQMAIVMNADSVLSPISTETATIDYAELSRSADGVSIQLAAAEKAMVRKIIKATEQAPAKLLASGCEISVLAASRALIIPRSAKLAHMLVDIGAQTTGVICASGRDIFFLRVLDIGGDDFTNEVAKACDCSFERADYIKQTIGLDPDARAADISDEERKRGQAALIRMADRLCDEINRTREYYINQPGGREISGMTLIGGGSRLAGLDDQLELFSGIDKVYPPQPVPAFSGVEEIDIYATAIGLAESHNMSLLPDSDRLNLSMAAPGQRRHSKISVKKHKERVKASGIGQRKQTRVSTRTLAIFGVILSLGFSYYVGSIYFGGQNDALKENVKNAEKENKLSGADVKPPVYLGSPALPEPDPYNTAVDEMMANPNPTLISEVLKKLDPLNVTDIDIQSSGNASLGIKGRLPDGQDINVIQTQLETIPGLAVTSPIKEGSAAQAGKSFELTVQLPLWEPKP